MRGNKAGGWIALLLLFVVETQCVTSTTPIKQEMIQYRLPTSIIPTSYNITITPFIDEENSYFNGDTVISIQILGETSNITLHAYYNIKIHENLTSLTDAQGKSIKPKSHYRDNTTDFLILSFEPPCKSGNYSLNFEFVGNVSNEPVGIYKSSYMNEKNERTWLVSTRLSPTKARRVFPCWDEPALKATFNISVKHFPNYTAASNMPLKVQINANNGKKLSIFNTTPIMSTYLVAFIISDFQCISNANKSISTCVQKEILPAAKFLQDINERALPLLVEYTGIPYSLPKLDSYAIPEADSDGMENWGLIVYRASTLVNNNSSDGAKESATEIFIHELAHQWFGNLVTAEWWKYIWLKEGLSSYMQFYIGNKMFPEWDLMNTFVTRVIQTGAFTLESSTYYNYLNWEPKSPAEIKSHFSILVYRKGASIIHMLNHIIGEDDLREGIRIYLKKHQYGTASSDDFWRAMQEAHDPDGATNIKEVMDPWIKQKGYPIVTVTRDYKAGTALLSQSPNLLSEMDNEWYIPLNYVTQSEPSCACTLPAGWLQPNQTCEIINKLKKDDWLIVNLKQSGYYRVDYDETNWLKIAKFLNSDNFTTIHVLNRAQIINDLFYMVMNDRQNLTTFFEVIKYLSREVEYIPWRQAFNSFSSLRSKIQDKEFSDNLKKYALHLMKNITNKIGFSEQPSDTYMMRRWRPEILTYACCYGHIQCRKIAGHKLIAFFKNSTENPLPANLENWIMNSAAYDVEAELMLQRKIDDGAYKYMKFLNVAKNHTFHRKFIEKAMTDSAISKNLTRLAMGQLRNGGAENWDNAVKYYIQNSDRISKYFNNTRIAMSILNDYIWVAPSLERMEKISQFIANNSDRTPSWIKSATAQQIKKLEWSKKNTPIFNRWLNEELRKTTLTD